MPPVNPLTPISSTYISRDSSNPQDQDIWFDAIDHVEMEDTWFEGAEAFSPHDEHHTDLSSSAGEAADSLVPFTQDCRRGVRQLVRTLGEYGESRMLSACLSEILPGTPASLVIAANSLYTAVTERRNIDTAALHALGLASAYLPENINAVSWLAAFIRDTVTGWTDETFLQQFLGNEENHTSVHLFTALAVTAIVAGRWMKDEGAPQRGALKVPAFMANIFIRASHYWAALGNMAGSLPSGAAIPENTGASQRAPAFEVDTRMEMTGDICDAAVPCSSVPRPTAFSSNSTARPEAYTRATLQSRPAPAPGKNTRLSVPEQAHYLAVEKHRQESGLSDLLNCATSKTESRQQTNEKIITSSYFNTKCDATAYAEPLRKAAESIPVHTDMPETQASSAATPRSIGEPLLPIVMTAATVATTSPYLQALKSKTGINAGIAMGLTGTVVIGGLGLRYYAGRVNEDDSNILSLTSTDHSPDDLTLCNSPQIASDRTAIPSERSSAVDCEYYLEINFIENVVTQPLDFISGYNKDNRIKRFTPVDNRYIPGLLIDITQDNAIDWRVRNEFDLIFRRAENSPDVRNATSSQEENIKLLLKTIQITQQCIDYNKYSDVKHERFESLSDILNKLWGIADNLPDDYSKEAVKQYKEHFGSYRENMSSTTEPYNLTDNPHRTKVLLKSSSENPISPNQQPPLIPRAEKRFIISPGFGEERSLTNTTSSNAPVKNLDDVKIEKMYDFSCIDERENLSTSDILRVISRALESPFKESAKEWQIFYSSRISGEGCPDTSQLHLYEDIFSAVDYAFRNIMTTFPHFLPVRIAQNLISPILIMIADQLDGRDANINNIAEINNEIISLAQMLFHSVDNNAKEKLFSDIASPKKTEGVWELKKGSAFIELEDNYKYKLHSNQKGTYIHTLNKENLEFRREYVEYKDSSSKWEFIEEPKPNVLPLPITGEKEQINLKELLLDNVRRTARKNISSRKFIRDILTKSGIIDKESFDKAIPSEISELSLPSYIDDITEIKKTSQLNNIKAGYLVFFQSRESDVGNKTDLHVMVSLGDGIFAGYENTFVKSFDESSNVIMAEQLGHFSDGAPGTFITNNNKSFNLVAGKIKESRVSDSATYKEAILNVDLKSLKKPGGGIFAITDLLSRTGDISVDFSKYVHRELLDGNLMLPNALKIERAISYENINDELPIGGILLLTPTSAGSPEEKIFALRLNENELFIPALHEPLIRKINGNSIFRIDEVEPKFKEYMLNQVTLTPQKLRVPMLLGKDSLFFLKDGVLHVRAHGFPGLVNYLHAEELINVIEGLSIFKGINLEKDVHTIELESCYGANNWPMIPSTGEAIANILGKKVIAYKGKYKSGMTNEGKVTFTGTSGVSNLEKYVRQFAGEKSLQTAIAVRKMFDYLTDVESPGTSAREKRSDVDFNSYILDVGRLILAKISSKTFINKYDGYYGINRNNFRIIKSQTLSTFYVEKDDFVDKLFEILLLDGKVFTRLSNIFNTDYSQEGTLHLSLPDYHITGVDKDDGEFIYRVPGEKLGLVGAGQFFSPRNWSEFGVAGDVYYDDKKNKYFILRKEGVPEYHNWHYPIDGRNNDEWMYSGTHSGSLTEPKGYSEYGKAGSVYYGELEGYSILRKDGRPSDHNWYYPSDSNYNDHFYHLKHDLGDFRIPHSPEVAGKKGSIYLFGEDYFLLKKTLKTKPDGETYPIQNKDNEYWTYAGNHKGTILDPKDWSEYGKRGCIYYHTDYGFLKLKVDGRPSDNNWFYPNEWTSNDKWQFLFMSVGTLESPKLSDVEGLAGEIYYDIKNDSYFILRRDGKPSENKWAFPEPGKDNVYWLYLDKNKKYFYNDLV